MSLRSGESRAATGATAYVGGAAGDAGDTKYRYRMDHRRRGRFIIINNKTFERNTGMNERKGTDADASSLKADFMQLGFDVTLVCNQTASEMLQLMINGNHCVHRTS